MPVAIPDIADADDTKMDHQTGKVRHKSFQTTFCPSLVSKVFVLLLIETRYAGSHVPMTVASQSGTDANRKACLTDQIQASKRIQKPMPRHGIFREDAIS